MAIIHPTAVIDPTAELGDGVAIGPYSIVGPHCRLGDGTRLDAHVVIKSHTVLGRECQVASGAVLGGAPQDLNYKDQPSYVRIGDRCIIRECVTVNRGTGENSETVVGDGCMLMAYSHVGHNAVVGNEVIMANSVSLAGYVEVGDYAFLGGMCVFHQFIKIGKLAIVSGASAARQDIPPFSMVAGIPADLIGINKVGLKRRGYSLDARTRIKKAFQMLWFSDRNLQQGIQAVEEEFGDDPLIQELLTFLRQSKRGVRRPTLKHRQSGAGSADSEADLVEVLG